jgi:hypothetical protein
MKAMIRKNLLFLAMIWIILAACSSPLEIARRASQADRTPTATPDLSAPALTPQPGGMPTQNPDQSSNDHPPCSNLTREESLPTDLWDNSRQQYHLVPIDPKNGNSLCGESPIPLSAYLHQAVSPDGKLLVSFNYRDDYYTDGSLSLIDLSSWQVITTTVKADTEINSMAIDPAGDLVAFALQPKPGAQSPPQSPLFLFDLKSRQIIASTLLDFVPRSMHFIANGKWLAVYGSTQGGNTPQQPSAFALLLWANNLGLSWRQQLNILDGSMLVGPKDQDKALVTFSPALAYDPAQELLYIVSANEEKFTMVDYRNRIIETRLIQSTSISWLYQLLTQMTNISKSGAIWGIKKQAVLYEDGSRLYITGQATSNETGTDLSGLTQGPFGLQVIDIKTGNQLDYLNTRATEIQMAKDGQYLFLRSWEGGTPSTDVLLAGSLEVLGHLASQSLITTQTFSGQLVFLSIQEGLTDSQVSLLDSNTFKPLYTWSASGRPLWLPN